LPGVHLSRQAICIEAADGLAVRADVDQAEHCCSYVNAAVDRVLVDASGSRRIVVALRCRFRLSGTQRFTPLLRVVDELFPDAFHDTARHTNNRIQIDQRNSAHHELGDQAP
jgi:hypothetical protein